MVRTEESDQSLDKDLIGEMKSVPCSSKTGSVAVWRNVGSYSRELFEGSKVSVANDLESRGARHCYTSCSVNNA